jgi:hypothetical protein
VRRREGLTERSLGTELLLHDADSDQVTALDAEATAVWRLCDGSHSIEELAAETGQPVEEVAGRLAALDDAGLLETVGMSRRALLLRAGLVGVGIPVGASILLPQAAAAASSLAFINAFSCTGTGNATLTLTITMTGGTTGLVFYNAYVYSDAGLTNQLGSDTFNFPNGSGVVTFTVNLGTAQTGGSTLYVRITKDFGGTDTVYQVTIPTSGLGSCT